MFLSENIAELLDSPPGSWSRCCLLASSQEIYKLFTGFGSSPLGACLQAPSPSQAGSDLLRDLFCSRRPQEQIPARSFEISSKETQNRPNVGFYGFLRVGRRLWRTWSQNTMKNSVSITDITSHLTSLAISANLTKDQEQRHRPRPKFTFLYFWPLKYQMFPLWWLWGPHFM